MTTTLTAQEAYDIAQANYLEKVDTQYSTIMASIKEAAEAGHMYADVISIASENKTKLLELDYKVVDCDEFVRISWYHKVPVTPDPDPTDPTDPSTDPSDPSDPGTDPSDP